MEMAEGKEGEWVQEVRISPDVNMVAMGGVGKIGIRIFGLKKCKIYQFAEIYEGITAPVVSIDWAKDSSLIMVNTVGNF
jgi:protease II